MKPEQHKCLFCKHFVVDEESLCGECHYAPPLKKQDFVIDLFPQVDINDWCSKFKRYRHPEEKELAKVDDRNHWVLSGERLFGSKASLQHALLNQEWTELMRWL